MPNLFRHTCLTGGLSCELLKQFSMTFFRRDLIPNTKPLQHLAKQPHRRYQHKFKILCEDGFAAFFFIAYQLTNITDNKQYQPDLRQHKILL